MFEKIENFIFALLLFLFPSQLALHFWPESSFVFGIRVDYLSPAIYLTDILILVLIGFWAFGRWSDFIKTLKKYRKTIYIFVLLAGTNILFSTFSQLSFFRWLKYLEFLIFAIYLKSKENYPLTPLYLSAVFFSFIGILQFATGGTLGGIMYFFGERLFDISTPGIALFNINGREFLRAYSTFAHPNSMAGYLGALSIYLLLSKRLKELNYKLLGFGIILLGFVLTFSTSAFVAVLLSLLIYKMLVKYQPKDKLVDFLLTVVVAMSILQIPLSGNGFIVREFTTERVAQRLTLAKGAGEMILKHPIFGEGLNTFIPNLSNYQTKDGNAIWLLQPVHNIFLLVLSEIGIIGLLIFMVLIYSVLKKSQKKKEYYLLIPLVFIILTGTTDHYWLTIQQNNLLLAFLISHFI